ncbi:hypothetical protein SDC9_34970 [bioreactor metagenome]|uniref:Uncharacterized protein n=1 Tax=bioreactor metagenome TaxID=1076179 RepID=A0A644VCD9_9ZZZZ|nr:hypothetical protein [Methanocorpusculum sp.]
MGMKFLSKIFDIDNDPAPNTIRRNTWRNTLQLFHKYRKNFTGPFYESGYRNYVLESGVTHCETGKDLIPDILAWDKNRKKLLIVEITNNKDEIKKTDQMRDFKDKIDIASLSVYGIPSGMDPELNTILSVDKQHNNSNYCQVMVDDIFYLKADENLSDPLLKENLINTCGQSLNKLPEIKVSLLPEMKAGEIRYGLSGIITKIFQPENPGYTSKELADIGLDEFVNKFSPNSRKTLADKITNQMNALVEKYLPDYIECENRKYRAKMVGRNSLISSSPQSRKAVDDGIRKWLGYKEEQKDTSIQFCVDQFGDDKSTDGDRLN